MPRPLSVMHGAHCTETPDAANYKAEHRGVLVTCSVFVGKTLEVEGANAGKFTFSSLYNMGYDSVWAPNGSGNGKSEFVVFNSDQVMIESVEYHGNTEIKNIWQKSQQ